MPAPKQQVSLGRLFARFFYLGLIGFGGSSAVLGLIQHECVEKHHSISEDEFLHGVAFAQILGPYAVNTAFFVGYQLAGLTGALTAVIGFLFPSFWIVVGLSYLYFHFHQIPRLQSALIGIGPVIIALILWAAYMMGRPKLKSPSSVVIALLAFAAAYWRVNTVIILAAAGGLGLLRYRLRKQDSH
jgi:chromate transporter